MQLSGAPSARPRNLLSHLRLVPDGAAVVDETLGLLGRLYMPAADLVLTWSERLLASGLGVVLILGVVVALLWWVWGVVED